ncbi:MAG: hypothetical protein HC880_03955 [Bacteroidia bacterium]|nr:hypothetical protein [Bacteroidia bacterium]
MIRTKRGFEVGRFERDSYDVALWKGAENGFERGVYYIDDLGDKATIPKDRATKDFNALIAHEYIELKLMEKGVSFRSMGKPDLYEPYDFGAHDLAPRLRDGGYVDLKLKSGVPIPNPTLSNLDQIVNTYIKLLNL